MTRAPFEEALTNLAALARPFNTAVVDALVTLNRRLEEARPMPIAPVHDPMSAAHPGQLLTLGEAARVLPRYVGPVVTVAGAMLRDWTVTLDPTIPTGRILVRPAALAIGVREYGDLELALLVAEHRRQATRFLRTTVVRVALESGLTDLRPFARPVGAA